MVAAQKVPGSNHSRSTHPLGSLIFSVSSSNPFKARVIAVAIIVACLAVLLAAASVEPDPSGIGTHRQLGLIQCNVPVFYGVPCPTCGMTTAFAYAVRGRLLSGFIAQPAGLLLALMTMVTLVLAMASVVTGRGWSLNWYRITPVRLGLGVGTVLMGAWIFKWLTWTPTILNVL